MTRSLGLSGIGVVVMLTVASACGSDVTGPNDGKGAGKTGGDGG